MTLALDTGLSAYEASSLLVAGEVHAELLTCDEHLMRVAGSGRRR